MSFEANFSVIVLAAGLGTRMKSGLPKVLHRLLGRPLIYYVLDTVLALEPKECVVVVGYRHRDVESALKAYNVKFALQDKQLGTGHAVICTKDFFKRQKGQVLIVCGDTPFLSLKTLKRFINSHIEQKNSVSVLSSYLDDPFGYGRILRDKNGQFLKIVEEKDASIEIKKIKEINTGVYVCDIEFLFSALSKITPNNAQKEYYLTDIISIAREEGLRVEAFMYAKPQEILGVNTRVQLSELENILLDKLRRKWMLEGVTFIMPETIYIEPDVTFFNDVIIEPNCVIKGKTKIGRGVKIGAFSFIKDVSIEDNRVIPPYSILTR